MANKKTKKKNTQASPESAKAEPKKAEAKKPASKKQTSKAVAAPKKSASTKKASKAKNAKPSFPSRVKKYFSSIRSEMKRVVWPSKKELLNYSVTVIVSLIVVGVVIALLDTVISEGLALLSGLRG